MLNLKLKGKRGNSSIEYAFLIALVIGALIGMQAYLKGSVSQRWRLAGDAFGSGRQYVAGSDSSQASQDTSKNTSQNTSEDASNTYR